MIKQMAVATIALFPAFAEAQQRQPLGAIPYYVCAPTESIEKSLRETYGEEPVYAWTTSPIHLNRLWVDAADGSATITRTNIEQGATCVLNEGGNAMQLEAKPVEPNL
jgi:hypothetical protein